MNKYKQVALICFLMKQLRKTEYCKRKTIHQNIRRQFIHTKNNANGQY